MIRPLRPATLRAAWLPATRCAGWAGLPAILARMERRRMATMPTIPPPQPRYTLEWLSGTTRGAVSVRTLKRHMRGTLPAPAPWLTEHVCLVCQCDLMELIGLAPVTGC